MTDDGDGFEIADGIKEQTEKDRHYIHALRDIEDAHLPEDATEAERMLLRAWLLGHEIVHIEYDHRGHVHAHVGFETADAETQPRAGTPIDRFDLRDCDSPTEVLELITV